MKKIILLALLTIVGVLGVSQMVLADSPVLSIVPDTLNNTVGVPFNVSAQINPAGSKVCAVRGTIAFSGLTCQNITVASGLIAATAPTCANPNFLIGIPKCTTIPQNIFSMSIKANQAGLSTLSFTGLRIMGAGAGVSSVWYGGAYNIASTIQPVTQQPTTQVTQPTITQTTTTPTEVTTPAQQTTPENNIPTGVVPAAGAAALSNSVPMSWFSWILIIVVILIIIYAIYWLVTRKKK